MAGEGGQAPANHARLIATLAAGNFAIGMGAFVVIGILSPLAADLKLTPAAAGMLMTVYAIAYGVLSPFLVALTGGIDRRRVLVAGLAIFTVSLLMTALAADLAMLYAARVLSALGAGMFTPIAASVAVAASAPERRGKALANVFLGMTLAQALGIPLGSFLGYTFGWRSVFFAVAALAGLTLVLAVRTVPRGIAFQANSLRTLGQALTDWPALISVLVTASFTASAYILYTFVTPLLEQRMGYGREGVSMTLLAYGAGAVAGSWAAGGWTDRFGPLATLAGVASATALLVPAYSFLPIPAPALLCVTFLWSMLGWSFMVPQQARLIRQNPDRQAVALSLNAACIYIGASIGSAAGGAIADAHGLDWLGIASAAAMALGIGHLLLSERLLAGRPRD